MQNSSRFLSSLLIVGALFAGSCGGSGSTDSGLQAGQYDGTFTKNTTLSAASFQLNGATMTGYTTKSDEGELSGGCTRVMSRYQITLSVSGDVGTGSISDNVQYQGSGCPQSTQTLLSTINVRRTAGNGTGFANLEGTWELTAGTATAHLTVVGPTVTGDYLARPSASLLRFSGQLADPTVTLKTDSAIELAAVRH